MSFQPGPDEDDPLATKIIKYFFAGRVPLSWFVKCPGLLVMQYLFFWNWKRLVDPDSWQVIVAGVACWLTMAIFVAVFLMLAD